MTGIPKCVNGLCNYFKSTEIDGCSRPLKSMDNCDDSIVAKVEPVKGDECACGVTKEESYPFCYQCWGELPQELKRQLFGYNNKYPQYDDAYEEAHQYLVDNGGI